MSDQLAGAGTDYRSSHFLYMSQRADGLCIKRLQTRQWPFIKVKKVGQRRHPFRKEKDLKWHDFPKASITKRPSERGPDITILSLRDLFCIWIHNISEEWRVDAIKTHCSSRLRCSLEDVAKDQQITQWEIQLGAKGWMRVGRTNVHPTCWTLV